MTVYDWAFVATISLILVADMLVTRARRRRCSCDAERQPAWLHSQRCPIYVRWARRPRAVLKKLRARTKLRVIEGGKR